jgi:TRAP-type C4-dicarboxylate transport system substrate-binding protein
VRGLKVRTMENQVHMRAFQTLGALPTPMAFSELVPALQQGTVDGQENPIPVIVANNLNQVQRFLSLTRHVYSPAVLIGNPAFLNRLSAADRAIFQEAAKAAVVANRNKVTEDEQNGVAELRRRGMTVRETVDTAAFQAALAPAFQAYAQQFGAANIDRIRNWQPGS